jgi:hypothetical protein
MLSQGFLKTAGGDAAEQLALKLKRGASAVLKPRALPKTPSLAETAAKGSLGKPIVESPQGKQLPLPGMGKNKGKPKGKAGVSDGFGSSAWHAPAAGAAAGFVAGRMTAGGQQGNQ